MVKTGYKQTEVGVIPADWNEVPITSLLERRSSITYGVVQPGKDDPDGVLFVRGGDVYGGKILIEQLRRIPVSVSDQYSRTRLSGGEILISLVGYPGEVAMVPLALSGANIARQVALVKLDSVHPLCHQYVCLYLGSGFGRRQLLKEAIGSAQQVINLRDIKNVAVVLPPDETEQRAIASALSDVDALLGALDRLIAKKRDLKQAAMQQLLTGQTRLPGFKGEWRLIKFHDLAMLSKNRVDPKRSGSHNFCIELENIGQGTGWLLDWSTTTPQSSVKATFEPGDILFGKLRAYLRKYWLADCSGVCSTEIWVLKTNPQTVVGSYLYQLMAADRFIEAASTAYGTHMPRSDWKVVRDLEFLVPNLKEEQQAIALALSDMDAELAALEQLRDKARAIKQGMMQELLTGRTRLVNPDGSLIGAQTCSTTA